MSGTPSPRIKSLCVFCGASTGGDPIHREAAAKLGRILAESGVTLVYGGGHLGLMGILADSALKAGGRVIGIIPEHLMRVEAAFHGITELVVVDSMHTRKRRMFDLAEAFCVMPGGFGTLDETFEILTWKQLKLHNKPITLCNVGGYWDPWVKQVSAIVEGGFARPDITSLFSVVDSVDEILPALLRDADASQAGEPQLF